MKTMNMKLVALAVIAGALLWTVPAQADTISIGLQEAGVNSGLITLEGSGVGTFAISAVSYGTFTTNSAVGTGNPPLLAPELLDSNSLNVSTSGSGTLNVWITSSGNTTPIGTLGFISSLTSNSLPLGWTVTTKTFLDAGNGVFTTTTPLASHMFSTIGTDVEVAAAATGAGPYSVTTEYIIVASGAGSANSTINIALAPEPSSVLLLGAGLVGLGLMFRRKRI